LKPPVNKMSPLRGFEKEVVIASEAKQSRRH
jgi:hypothetical protein